MSFLNFDRARWVAAAAVVGAGCHASAPRAPEVQSEPWSLELREVETDRPAGSFPELTGCRLRSDGETLEARFDFDAQLPEQILVGDPALMPPELELRFAAYLDADRDPQTGCFLGPELGADHFIAAERMRGTLPGEYFENPMAGPLAPRPAQVPEQARRGPIRARLSSALSPTRRVALPSEAGACLFDHDLGAVYEIDGASLTLRGRADGLPRLPRAQCVVSIYEDGGLRSHVARSPNPPEAG